MVKWNRWLNKLLNQNSTINKQMKTSSKIIIAVVAVAVIGLIAIKLMSNKKTMQAKTESAIQSEQFDVIPVKAAVVTKQNIENQFRQSGVFKARQELKLAAEAQGQIVKMHVKKGDIIRKGQMIASVDNAAVQSELATAHAQLEKAKKDAERYANAEKAGGVSTLQAEEYFLKVQNAETNIASIKQRLANYQITAPMAGIVNEIFTEQGSFVTVGKEIIDLVDLSTMNLVVDLEQGELIKNIKIGKKVSVTTDVYREKIFPGQVKAVNVKSDISQKFQVEISVGNSFEFPILSGMYGYAAFDPIAIGSAVNNPQVLTIPRAALTGSVKDAQVFIVNNNNTVSLKSINIGRTIGNDVEVTGGLNEGEKVVVSGQINLAEGRKVSVNN
jgi:membrane fusion protein, multidrug efflux system